MSWRSIISNDDVVVGTPTTDLSFHENWIFLLSNVVVVVFVVVVVVSVIFTKIYNNNKNKVRFSNSMNLGRLP